MLKLNDFVNPQNQNEGIGLMRCLKNSIKRNIILPSLPFQKTQVNSEYETKLTGHNFDHKDLFLLFQHLYCKDEMSISDRNLVRRILLSIFPESLISAGGKKLIFFTKYLNLPKGSKFNGENMFYLVMKGTVRVNSPFYQKNYGPGTFFGHLELLTELQSNSFVAKVESDVSLICVTQQGFHETLAHYFEKLHDKKVKSLPKILTDILEPIQICLICEQMVRKQYQIGNKINRKGDLINQILIIQQGKINQDSQMQAYQRRYRAENSIGFVQILMGSKFHLFDSFALEQTHAFSIPLNKFKKIAQKDLLNSLKKQNKMNLSGFDHSFIAKSKTQQTPKNETKIEQTSIQSLNKFMRIRKVNLPYNNLKSPASQARQSTQASYLERSKAKFGLKYQASFIFIKSTQTPQRRKQSRVNRSFSLIRQQAQPTSFKRYLDNIDVPSLAQFKSTESQLF